MMGQRTHVHRGVAQLGSASALGAEGRRFKSCHPDQPRPQCRGFSYDPGGVHAVLSHHHDGYDAGTRPGPGRSRGRRPLRHSTRILGHRDRRGSASCDSALHRRRRLRGPGYSRRDHRCSSSRRRGAPIATGSRRARPLPLPDPLTSPDPTSQPRPRPRPHGSDKRVRLRTRRGRDRLHTPVLARRRETSWGP